MCHTWPDHFILGPLAASSSYHWSWQVTTPALLMTIKCRCFRNIHRAVLCFAIVRASEFPIIKVIHWRQWHTPLNSHTWGSGTECPFPFSLDHFPIFCESISFAWPRDVLLHWTSKLLMFPHQYFHSARAYVGVEWVAVFGSTTNLTVPGVT